MNEVDYAIIALVAASAALGVLRGFLREALGLATWVLALWAAWAHSDIVTPYLGAALSEPFRLWAARGIVLVVVLAAGTLVSVLVSEFVSLTLFRGLDRLLGFLFGALRAGVVVGVAVMLGQRLDLDGESWWKSSKLMPYGESAAVVVKSIVGDAADSVLGGAGR
jgi:membrane protein required for colicin V production